MARTKKTEETGSKATIHEMDVRIRLTEEALGTSPSDPDIYRQYIASQAPDAERTKDEIEAIGVDAVAEKGMTIFGRNEDGDPIVWDYQLKGFFKDACKMLRKNSGTYSSKLTSYKQVIDGNIFVKERQIPFVIPEDAEMGDCQRPLRAQTPQGERVSLAYSTTVPAGSKLYFTIFLLDKSYIPYVKEWLGYGQVRGLGQWRNSGKGKFKWKLLDERDVDMYDVIDIDGNDDEEDEED